MVRSLVHCFCFCLLLLPFSLLLTGKVYYNNSFRLMASKSSDCRVSKSGLKPTYIHDNVGVYLSIPCSSVTGFLYLNKLDESKKSLGKCILANNVWYTPPEFEALGGKRARRWKQSLIHIGKPLGDYDLSCPQPVRASTNRSLLPQPQSHPSSGSNVSTGAPIVVENIITSSARTPVSSLSSTDNVLTSPTS